MHTELLHRSSGDASADEPPNGYDCKGVPKEISALAQRDPIQGMKGIRDVTPPYLQEGIGGGMKPYKAFVRPNWIVCLLAAL